MPTIRIPTPLRTYSEGQAEVALQGSSVSEILDDLVAHYPALRPHLFNGDGQLRPFVNLFLNEDNVKDLQGLETPLKEEDRLMLIPSIAGGATSATCYVRCAKPSRLSALRTSHSAQQI